MDTAKQLLRDKVTGYGYTLDQTNKCFKFIPTSSAAADPRASDALGYRWGTLTATFSNQCGKDLNMVYGWTWSPTDTCPDPFLSAPAPTLHGSLLAGQTLTLTVSFQSACITRTYDQNKKLINCTYPDHTVQFEAIGVGYSHRVSDPAIMTSNTWSSVANFSYVVLHGYPNVSPAPC